MSERIKAWDFLKTKYRLPAGSKRKVQRYIGSLLSERDDPRPDMIMFKWLRGFVKSENLADYDSTFEYLTHLRSSSDGKLFSQRYKSVQKLIDGVEKFEKPNYTSFRWNRNYQESIKEMKEEFSKFHLKRLYFHNDEEIRDALPKLSTHPGSITWEYPEKEGKQSKQMYLEGSYSRLCGRVKDALEGKNTCKPMMVAVRTQGSGRAFDDEGNRTNDCDHKTRPVLMVHFDQIVDELQYSVPLQDRLCDVDWYAGGKDTKSISSLVRKGRNHVGYTGWTSLDYSGFDSSLSDWLIEDAFDIVKAAFDDWNHFEGLDDLQFNGVVKNFIHKELVLDHIVVSHRGVASGSMFTQIIDSVCNRLMVMTYMKSIGVSDFSTIVMGDDNLIWSPDIDINLMSSYFEKNFGVKFNVTKTTKGSIDDDPKFLSRVWTSQGEDREIHSLLAKMWFSERKRRYTNEGGNVTPELLFYSYLLEYSLAIKNYFNVSMFWQQNPHLVDKSLQEMGIHELPGSLYYRLHYGSRKWRDPVLRVPNDYRSLKRCTSRP